MRRRRLLLLVCSEMETQLSVRERRATHEIVAHAAGEIAFPTSGAAPRECEPIYIATMRVCECARMPRAHNGEMRLRANRIPGGCADERRAQRI